MTRFTLALSLIILSIGVCLLPQPAWALSYTFMTLDVPGIGGLDPHGINDVGQIVGTYFHPYDGVFPIAPGPEVVTPSPGGWTVPFVYSNGVVTPLSTALTTAPDRYGPATADDINDAGQIVGNDGHNNYLVSIADVPAARLDLMSPYPIGPSGFANTAHGINNLGQVAVWSNFIRGIYDSHTRTLTNLESLIGVGPTPMDINDSGMILTDQSLFYDFSDHHFGILFDHGTQTQIAFPGAASTVVSKLNDAGEIVGSYTDADGTPHGFVLRDGTYTTVEGTSAIWGVNDLGWIVGERSGGGFLGIPDTLNPEPSPVVLLMTGFALLFMQRYVRKTT
jgi:uncharacterized membrane protein